MLALSFLAGAATVYAGVDPATRVLLHNAFSAVCHQIPERSPHLMGVLLPVCHRCYGIYIGLLMAPWVALLWPTIRTWIVRHTRPAVVLSLIPIGLDWSLSALQVWPNAAGSRMGTGVVFGLVSGLIVTVLVIWPQFGQRPKQAAIEYIGAPSEQHQ